jgi:uncharacterized protein (DUF488 family)
MPPIRLFTIGFTKKSAREFFTTLINAGVKRVLDIRLGKSSQLAGFAKGEDLRFFLEAIGYIEYVHRPELAPTRAILDAFKKQGHDWARYERDFLALLAERCVEHALAGELRDGDCLLCSEATPVHCHRRLVAEYLAQHLGPSVSVCHL